MADAVVVVAVGVLGFCLGGLVVEAWCEWRWARERRWWAAQLQDAHNRIQAPLESAQESLYAQQEPGFRAPPAVGAASEPSLGDVARSQHHEVLENVEAELRKRGVETFRS